MPAEILNADSEGHLIVEMLLDVFFYAQKKDIVELCFWRRIDYWEARWKRWEKI